MPPAASQILVMFDTVMLRMAASGRFRPSSPRQDLNSGQLVRVARTRKPINPLGVLEWSAAKETTGSRK